MKLYQKHRINDTFLLSKLNFLRDFDIHVARVFLSINGCENHCGLRNKEKVSAAFFHVTKEQKYRGERKEGMGCIKNFLTDEESLLLFS